MSPAAGGWGTSIPLSALSICMKQKHDANDQFARTFQCIGNPLNTSTAQEEQIHCQVHIITHAVHVISSQLCSVTGREKERDPKRVENKENT